MKARLIIVPILLTLAVSKLFGPVTVSRGPIYAADITAPAFASASSAINGTTLTINWSEPVTRGVGYADSDIDLDASLGGADRTLTYVSGDGTSTFVYTIGTTIVIDETLDLDFNGDANSLEDGVGNDMAAITSALVTNMITATAATFGSGDYLRQTDGIGLSAGKVFTFSGWLNPTADDGFQMLLFARNDTSGATFRIFKSAQDRIEVRGLNTAGTVILEMNSANDTIIAAGGWYHVAISVDMANGATEQLYIDGADALEATTVFTDDNLCLDRTHWTIGADDDNLLPIVGAIAEFWFDNQKVDLASAITSFRQVGGTPADLAGFGTPAIWLHSEVPNYETNSGGGGNFTETGTIDFATPPP